MCLCVCEYIHTLCLWCMLKIDEPTIRTQTTTTATLKRPSTAKLSHTFSLSFYMSLCRSLPLPAAAVSYSFSSFFAYCLCPLEC